ncbi:hypothetical protein ACSS6W_008164 [Trichoderma asperelloides]
MTAVMDPPVIRELAAILEGIDYPLGFNDSDFDTCRAFTQDNNRCQNTIAQKNKVYGLLSQFRAMTKCVDTNDFYEDMKNFISLTHCKRYHRNDALAALNRWKIQRKAAISRSRPISPPRSATSYNDSFESVCNTSSMGSLSFTSDGLEDDESFVDSYIAEKTKGLKIAPDTRGTPAQTAESGFDEIEAEKERFKRLGDVKPPIKGEEHDNKKISQAIKSCLGSDNMDAGSLYVLKHTEISGLFKIGWSRASVTQRFKSNCFKNETEPLYATTGRTIIGALQAEKIAHAILSHKKISIVKCRYCDKPHKEWFLASEEEVLDAVTLAEQWLTMPAYALKEGGYALTPQAVDIHGSMFPFSMSKMKVLMDLVKKADSISGVFPKATSTATVRETIERSTSPPSVKSATPRILISKSPDIITSQLYGLLGEPPLGGLGGKGDGTFIETTQEIYRSESREATPEGDYKVFVEIKKIRTKLSHTNIKEDSQVDEQTNIKEDSQVDKQTNIKEDSQVDKQTNIKEDSQIDEQTNIEEDSKVYECSGPTISDVKGKEQKNRKYWISKAKNKLGFKSPRPESLETSN